MNAASIKNQMSKSGFNLNEWNIEKGYKCYNVYLTTFGINDTERQQMTGDQVNEKRQSDNDKVEQVAKLFDVEPERSGIRINTEQAPATW